MIKKKDKEKAQKEAKALEKMIKIIRKREEKAFHQTSVITRRCERLRREVLEYRDILLGNCSITAFLDVIINPEVEVILATT